eukprot:tig00020553_g10676.t1
MATAAQRWAAAEPSSVVLTGHTDDVTGVDIAKDGRLVVSASADGTIRLWSAPDARELRCWDRALVGKRVVNVRFSSDGSRIVSSGGKRVSIWDAHSMSRLQLLRLESSVYAADFSPDAAIVVIGNGDGCASLWSPGAADTDPVDLWECGDEPVLAVACSPNGFYAAGAYENKVVVSDIRLGGHAPPLDICGHTGTVSSLAFSPDGSRLVSGSYDKTVRVWETRTGALLRCINASAGEVNGVAYSKDGTLIASVSDDGAVRLWSPAGNLIRQLCGHGGIAYSVAISADRYLLQGPHGPRLVRRRGRPRRRARPAARHRRALRLRFRPGPGGGDSSLARPGPARPAPPRLRPRPALALSLAPTPVSAPAPAPAAARAAVPFASAPFPEPIQPLPAAPPLPAPSSSFFGRAPKSADDSQLEELQVATWNVQKTAESLQQTLSQLRALTGSAERAEADATRLREGLAGFERRALAAEQRARELQGQLATAVQLSEAHVSALSAEDLKALSDRLHAEAQRVDGYRLRRISETAAGLCSDFRTQISKRLRTDP